MNKELTKQPLIEQAGSGFSRRKFLGLAGGLAAAGVIFNACNRDDDDNTPGVNLGSGDVGILNYAYALEQLEAAFYTQVVLTPYSGISSSELSLLSDIRNHEVAHREFFKAAITAVATPIPALEVDFSTINFTDRNSVLGVAKAFEDLGVSAYNGAGQLIKEPLYLLLAGKIVSVEARHAALIRDLIQNGSFASGDVVDASGLDVKRTPSEVLAIADTYIKTKINASNLPTS